ASSRLSRFQDDLDTAVLFILELLVCVGPLIERHPVGDQERGVDLALLDAPEEIGQEPVDVRLPHLEGEALVEGRTEGNFVDHAAVDAGQGDDAPFAARLNRFAEYRGAIRLRPDGLLRLVVRAGDAEA